MGTPRREMPEYLPLRLTPLGQQLARDAEYAALHAALQQQWASEGEDREAPFIELMKHTGRLGSTPLMGF